MWGLYYMGGVRRTVEHWTLEVIFFVQFYSRVEDRTGPKVATYNGNRTAVPLVSPQFRAPQATIACGSGPETTAITRGPSNGLIPISILYSRLGPKKRPIRHRRRNERHSQHERGVTRTACVCYWNQKRNQGKKCSSPVNDKTLTAARRPCAYRATDESIVDEARGYRAIPSSLGPEGERDATAAASFIVMFAPVDVSGGGQVRIGHQV
ncbi:hypothetical protein C8R44DRAFT_746939 [Mycena epipterygia]|nr:hypothetical protein C8R44DRAFT_746939 [Mycena epipterygia]